MLTTPKHNQLPLDDAQATVERGLQVVRATFRSAEPFDWSLFDGFDSLRVLTYSASAPMIMWMLDRYSFQRFECIFGSEKTLGTLADVIAFQQFLIEQVRECALELRDERQRLILEKIHAGAAQFYVVKDHVAHAKLYLLESQDPQRRRAIVGSANLSKRAFGGKQPETLVVFDDDERAWKHYSREYEAVKETATDRVELPTDLKIAKIPFTETPILQDKKVTVFQPPHEEELTAAQVVQKVEALVPPVERIVSPQATHKNGRPTLTTEAKEVINKQRWRKGQEEAEDTKPPTLTIRPESRHVSVSGEPVSLETDAEGVRRSAAALVDYFNNYGRGFVGDVPRLQRDYFTFMSWLYISPFICDLRTLATNEGGSIFRYPSFAIIYGISGCGKSSLVDTLMISMFGHPSMVQKDNFTRQKLRGLQQNYHRYPVFFDDITRSRFTGHGLDVIKDEIPPPVREWPCFILSMNAELESFPDEVVKRCLMIYVHTSLPSHEHVLVDKLHASMKNVRNRLTTDFYRRYLAVIMDKLDTTPLPDDILRLSSETIHDLLSEYSEAPLPHWCRPVDWADYVAQRHEPPARRLAALLSREKYRKKESDGDQGWTLQDDNIVVWGKLDPFGRTPIKEDIPDFLCNATESRRDTFVLYRQQTEDFLGQKIRAPGFRWLPWGKGR